MASHFEELWEQCENFQKDATALNDVQHIIDELMLKINLYKAIDAKQEIPAEDRQKVKSRTLGEILLTLTALSLKDNVNVYEALNIALQYRSADYYIRTKSVKQP
jgi:hypothetical protein